MIFKQLSLAAIIALSLSSPVMASDSRDLTKEHLQYAQYEAKQGNPTAQTALGLMYNRGVGVIQDHKEAVKWYNKAAEQGYVDAQYNLGVMYNKGIGVIQDHKEAVKWYSKAAKQGYADAQYDLGIMYLHGVGVIQNYTNAYSWLLLARYNGYDTSIAMNLFPPSFNPVEAQALAKRCLDSNYKDCD